MGKVRVHGRVVLSPSRRRRQMNVADPALSIPGLEVDLCLQHEHALVPGRKAGHLIQQRDACRVCELAPNRVVVGPVRRHSLPDVDEKVRPSAAPACPRHHTLLDHRAVAPAVRIVWEALALRVNRVAVHPGWTRAALLSHF